MSGENKPRGRRKKGAVPTGKRPFDIEEAMSLLRDAVKAYPRAALFELAVAGHTSVFEILIACILSIRTRDETTLPVARALFARAATPAEVAALSLQQIDRLIQACTLYRWEELVAPMLVAVKTGNLGDGNDAVQSLGLQDEVDRLFNYSLVRPSVIREQLKQMKAEIRLWFKDGQKGEKKYVVDYGKISARNRGQEYRLEYVKRLPLYSGGEGLMGQSLSDFHDL